jgi:hypothetical protein
MRRRGSARRTLTATFAPCPPRRASTHVAGTATLRLGLELARTYGPRAIEVLAELMDDAKASASARAMAAERILDRAYGKPAQFTTGQAAEFKKAVDMSDDELAAVDMSDDELAAIVAAGRGKVLELVKPVAPTLPHKDSSDATN